LAAAQATFDRYRNGSRADEIAVGEAVVRYAQARADEAAKALGRADAMQEGVTITTARLLEVQRDARIAAAQLEEARSKLSLLRAGSREEDIRHAQALRDTAGAQLEAGRARLEQCTIHAPADGTVLDVPVNPGQFVSFAVPQPLLHIAPDGPLRIRAEVDVRDRARICIAQSATVTADALPSGSARAEVASISPVAAPRKIAAAAAQTQSGQAQENNVVAVVLDLAGSAPPLPIGSSVAVSFDPCPSRS
jgi:multidrug resistance efflux pump